MSTEDRIAHQVAGATQETRQQSVDQDHTTQPNTSQAVSTQARSSTAVHNGNTVPLGAAVYIGNLQWWTTDADLETLCSKYGQILSLKTFEDKITGKSKGYVLVHFAAPDAAASCQAELNG